MASSVSKQVSEENGDPNESYSTGSYGRWPKSRNSTEALAARVSSKLEEGDYRGAVRLACSRDTIAEQSPSTIEAMKLKHPPRNLNSIIEDQPHPAPLGFTVNEELIRRAIMLFPSGSSGGTDGLLPQHLKDLIGPAAEDGAVSVLNALTALITLILEGRTPVAVRSLLFGAKLTALTKENGGLRPIAVGSTIRRLASKCACLHALNTIPDILAPHQLGFGISSGVEAAVHATRINLHNLPSNKALIKVDFENAFNSVRRDKMLYAVKKFIPELLPYVHSAYSTESVLLWEKVKIISLEGIQQGDPIGPLLFCLSIHDLVSSLKSEYKIFYLDDGTIGGTLEDISADLSFIEEAGEQLGLRLNVAKSELICNDGFDTQDMPVLADLQYVSPDQAMLLGSPLGAMSLKKVLDCQISQLQLIGECLHHLHAHDALTLLRHSFSVPKLLHILRTSPAFLTPLLISWDHLLLSILSKITNLNFHPDDPCWLQATLPVWCGGLGIRRASHLAPTAFLASADGALSLMLDLLPAHLSTTQYEERDFALRVWKQDLPPEMPAPTTSSRQKVWDRPRIDALFDTILTLCNDDESKARLLAAGSAESGAWLNAPPVSSLGLRMSDEAIRIAVGLRVGAPLGQPHQCVHCGSDVDQFFRHGLSCRFSQGRLSRHNTVNSLIQHALTAAKIPSRLEPSGLHRADGKRPDGMTMVPWEQGKYLVWDATCVDTFCQSHRRRAATEPGGAAAHAEEEKAKKYAHLDSMYLFQPVALETCGTIGPKSRDFLREPSQRLKMVTGEARSCTFLLQRISIAIQVGNAASVIASLPDSANVDISFDL